MWKRKLPQTLIEAFSCVWKSRLTVLQNHHWNAIRIWWINVRYALFNHLGGYRNIMLFQISSRRKNRSRDTRVIKIRVFENVFRTQFCFIRYRRQHLQAAEWRRYSRFTFVENSISNLPQVLRAKFMRGDRLFCFISICKFGSFKIPFASLSGLYFRFWRFIR